MAPEFRGPARLPSLPAVTLHLPLASSLSSGARRTFSHHPKEFRWTQDADALVPVEFEQVSVSRHNDVGPRFASTFQDAVIIWIGTNTTALFWLKISE